MGMFGLNKAIDQLSEEGKEIIQALDAMIDDVASRYKISVLIEPRNAETKRLLDLEKNLDALRRDVADLVKVVRENRHAIRYGVATLPGSGGKDDL